MPVLEGPGVEVIKVLAREVSISVWACQCQICSRLGLVRPEMQLSEVLAALGRLSESLRHSAELDAGQYFIA